MKRKITFLIALAVVFLYGVTVHAENYSISQTKATINVGETIDLDISGTDKAAVWKSYNANTATVNQKGEVTALKAGKAVIAVRAGLQFKTCQVTVVNTSIKMNKTSAVLYCGSVPEGNVQLKATTKGLTKNVTWKSSDTDIATVDSTGKVTAVSSGKAVITATANGVSADCNITVKQSSISLDYDKVTLGAKGVGSSVKVTPMVVGAKNTVKWTTSNKNVATVSGGKITGKQKGTAVVTATANGISASCEVTVNDGVSISDEKVLLFTDGVSTKQLQTNAAKTDVVTWNSSNNNVVTVSDTGMLKAVSEGTAVITAECNGKMDTCVVIVGESVTNIVEDTVYLQTRGDDKTYTLTSQILGSNTKATWTTNNKNVVAVSNGKLTAKKAGTAVVTVTANGKSDNVSVVVENYKPSITISNKQYTLYTGKGNKATLKATVDGISKTVTWTSSNNNVVTVSKGKITAVNAGTAIITAEANGVTDICNVTVLESEVDLSSTQLNLSTGETANILADVTGLASSVKWSSTNTKAVAVKNGVVTAKKVGEADIKATANGVTSVCHVIVADKCNHVYDDGVIRKQPSCVSVGSMVYTCTVCGSNYNEPTNITAHKYVDTIVSPTCEEGGYTEHVCSVCGDRYIDSETEPIGHKWSEKIIDATCSSLGTIIRTCDDCGKTETEDIPMTEHVYGAWNVIKAATTTEEGIRQRVCTVCGSTDEETIPKLSEGHVHDYKETIKNATCTEDGYRKYECSCGDSYTEVIPARGHNAGEWVVVSEATCSNEGKEIVTCTTCKETLNTRVIPKTSHASLLEAVTKQPTCSEEGTKTTTCEVCGEVIAVTAIPKTEHVEGEWTVTTQATCSKEGTERLLCRNCNTVLDTRTIEKTGHVQGAWITTKKATCTETGIETVSCIYCGTEMDTREIEKSEHSYNISTRSPNCTNEGLRTKTCRVCGYVETETLPALGHTLTGEGTVVAATCEADGYTQYRCSVCYDLVKQDIVEKTGHSPSEWHIIQTPDCSHTQIEGIVCLNCNKILEQTVGTETGDHVFEFVKTVPAYSCSDGYTLYTCKSCGRSEMRDIVPATGNGIHVYNFDNYVQIGNTYVTPCTICGVKRQFQSLEAMESAKKDQDNDALAIQKVTEVIGEIITDDMTDVEKVYAVNDWMCRNCVYDEDLYKWVLNNGGILFPCDATETRGVMLNGTAVCSGYSSAFKEFMDQLGIDCLIVTSRMMNHAWNQVKLDDGWYWLDVTFNDSENKDGFFFTKYFLLTEKRIYSFVEVNDEEGGVECNGTKYLKGGAMYDKYFVETLEDVNDMYELQKDKSEILIKRNTSFSVSEIQNQYKTMFNESLNVPFINLGDGTRVICYNNTEKLKQLFEKRIAESEKEETEEVVNAIAEDEDVEDENSEEDNVSTTDDTENVEENSEDESSKAELSNEETEESADEEANTIFNSEEVVLETEIITETELSAA